MEAYAVLETGGKQVLVKVGDTVEIEKIEAEEGKEVALDTVCAVSDGTTLKVGTPYVEGAKVTLAVVGVKRGVKTIIFKAKRRKGSRRTVGHRQQIYGRHRQGDCLRGGKEKWLLQHQPAMAAFQTRSFSV